MAIPLCPGRLLALALLSLAAAPATAFTIDDAFFCFDAQAPPCLFSSGSTVNVQATLEGAPRWSTLPIAGRGLHDGIQVGIAPGLAEAFGASTAPEIASFEQAVSDAFGAWESPSLGFDLTFDAATTLGSGTGLEIDVLAVPFDDPNLNGFDGFATFTPSPQPLVGLTNGTTIANGFAIFGADIFLSIEAVTSFGANAVDYLLRLLMHEVGHAIGLEHANEFSFANFDQDGDPTNEMPIDPLDPTAGLMLSAAFDPDAIMSTPFSGASLFATALAFDDAAGRDVLYPLAVPEWAVGWAAISSLAPWLLRRKR